MRKCINEHCSSKKREEHRETHFGHIFKNYTNWLSQKTYIKQSDVRKKMVMKTKGDKSTFQFKEQNSKAHKISNGNKSIKSRK